MHDNDETKESMYILILTINREGLYHNLFLMVDLNILKLFQCLHMSTTKTEFGYTLIVDVEYPEYLQPLHKDL